MSLTGIQINANLDIEFHRFILETWKNIQSTQNLLLLQWRGRRSCMVVLLDSLSLFANGKPSVTHSSSKTALKLNLSKPIRQLPTGYSN